MRNKIAKSKFNFKIIHWNCFKLSEARIFEFKLFLKKFSPDIVSIQEVKLNKEDGNLKLRFESYYTYHKPRVINPEYGGGVAFLIKQGISFSEIQEIGTEFELIGIKLDLEDSCFNLFSIYSPPNEIISYELFVKLSKLDGKTIIMGDLNSKTPSVGCKSYDISGRVLDIILLETELVVFNNNIPTYHKFGSNYKEILDIIMGSFSISSSISQFEVLEDYEMGSDHSPLLLILNNKKIEIEEKKRDTVRLNFNKANWFEYKQILHDKANMLLNNTDLKNYDVDKLNDIVTQNISEATHASIPRYDDAYENTLPQEIICLIRKRREIRKIIKKNKSPLQVTEYNKLTGLIQKSIKDYTSKKWNKFLSKLGPYPASTRVFWQKINKAREQSQKSAIPNLIFKKKIYKSDFDKSCLFSNILAETFKDNSGSDEFDSVHKEKVNNEIQNFKIGSSDMEQVSISEIYNIIKKLKTQTSPGMDQVHNILIKNLPFNYVKIIQILSNLAIKTGSALYWKSAVITMIPKKESNSNSPGDYRPISLISCLGKLVERIVRNRLYKILERDQKIITQQSGFRSYRGALDNLLFFTQKISESMNRKKKVCGILFDISKAFDRVWHLGIIYKLKELNVPLYLINFIKKFLENRTFCIKINNTKSEIKKIDCGVPQGSVLGPLLFLIYINDLPMSNEKFISYSALFADDLGAIFIFKKIGDIKKKIDNFLESLSNWLSKWRLRMNTHKCSYTIFSKTGRCNIELAIKLKNELIPYKADPIFLGIIFDERLNFNKHIESLKFRSLKRLNIIKIFSHSK